MDHSMSTGLKKKKIRKNFLDEKILFILIYELGGTTLNFTLVQNALIILPYPGPAILQNFLY